MDQTKIGTFIADCRKEAKLTQAQLAERLHISDRAVSKWETRKCLPDSSIMLNLCEILDISVNELLSGERLNVDDFAEKAARNLIEFKRKEEYALSKNVILSIVYTVFMAIAILVCCICDVATSGALTWSRITLSSILSAFLLLVIAASCIIGDYACQRGFVK